MSIGHTDMKITALYERLSRDDDLAGESNSKKRMLEAYAAEHGFDNCIHFTDGCVIIGLTRQTLTASGFAAF